MAAVQMKEFLEKGNIKNSVNFPNVILDDDGDRFSVIHKSDLNTNDILSVFTENGVTVKAFKSGAKENLHIRSLWLTVLLMMLLVQ